MFPSIKCFLATIGILAASLIPTEALQAQSNYGSQGTYVSDYPPGFGQGECPDKLKNGSGCTCEQPRFCLPCWVIGLLGGGGGGGGGGFGGGGGGPGTGGGLQAGGGGGGGGPGSPNCTNCISQLPNNPYPSDIQWPTLNPRKPVREPYAALNASGSFIDGISMSYYHWGWDYRPTDPDGVGLCRIHRPLDMALAGNFGPGVFSNYDQTITLSEATVNGAPELTANVFDPMVTQIRPYKRAYNASSGDFAILKPLKRDPMKKLTLLQSNLNPIVSSNTNPFHDAAFVLVEAWDGSSILFKLFNVGVSGQRIGRPTKFKTNVGETNIVYKTFTTAELTASPTRALQIDTVTDRFGNQLAFSYSTTQVSGQWVVSSITVPGSTTRAYNYSSGKLSSVDYPLSLQSTFTYSSDSACVATVIQMVDLAADVGHQKKAVYLSNMTTGQWTDYNLGTTFFNTVQLNSVRMLTNGNHEVGFLNMRGTSEYIMQYEGGGRMKVIGTQSASNQYAIYQEARSKYMKTWSTTASGNYGINSSWFTLSGTADTEEKWMPNLSSSPMSFDHTGSDGTQCHYEYDSDNFVIFKQYSDGTFEAYCYDANTKKLLRERDRLKRVTKYVYDSSGQLTEKHVGLEDHSSNTTTSGGYTGLQYYNRCATNDVQTAAYAVYKWEYVASGAAKGMISATIDPRNNRTDYEYNTQGRLWKVKQPADTTGGTRATTVYTYDTMGNVASITDPESHVVSYTYDALNRLTTTTFGDSTTDKIEYGTSGNGLGLVVKTIDRLNVVNTYDYDASQRLTTKVTAAATRSGSTDTATAYGVAVTETFTYLKGCDLVWKYTVNGALTENLYDYRGRLVETKTFPRAGKTLTASKQYENNQLYKSTDPYSRSTYYAFDATDGRLVRTIQGTVPEYTPPAPSGNQTYSQALLGATRNTSANATYIVQDIVYDAEGQTWKQFDGRNTETRLTYDGQGRTTVQEAAYGTSIVAKTETLYDAASNVTEVRSPRYFDSTDSEGYNKAKETWTYNNRNLVASHTEAPGTSIAATESFTYDLNGHKATHTDFAGKVWTMIEAGCCALTRASVDPLGHGSIVNADSQGRPVHQITVSDVTSHASNYNSPIDAKTLMESTTKYDARGRATHRTTWLTVRGLVDTASPPIAGLNSVAIADGLTNVTLYDDNLTDGQGLDNSTGVAVFKQSGTSPSGTFNVSLTNALTKLADTQANGGAGISFNSSQGAVGRAVVSINAEDEVSFSISDAAGRTVMSGKLNNYKGSGSTAVNTLATWSTQLHDTTASLSGYGTVLESKSIDALGYGTRTWTDAAGRTLRSFNQLDKATTVTFDASGNQLTVRDPNNAGADMVYDVLNRSTQRTDTVSAVTKTAYDKAGNAIKQTDAKNKDTFIAFDARGRRKQTTDRISAVTAFTYTALGQLASLTDAETQTTSYTYSDRGEKLTETYPDHSGGNPGDSTYGIVTFVYDNAGRLLRKQDQLGDTCTFNYDLAGRMTSRNYRTKVNSPSGTIADSDTFTFDRASHMLTAVSGRYSNTVTYTYDLVGRKAAEALTTNGQTYTIGTEYNPRGELVNYTYPDSSIQERTYHATGALNQLTLDGSTVSTRSYDDGTRLTGEMLGNGVTETRAYSNDNLLTSITYGGTGTAIGNLSYTWDANKNKTSETIGGVMATWGFTSSGTTYDHEDRLTGYARAGTSAPSQLSQSWSLTSVGNWSSTTINSETHTRTHGPTHELLSNKIGTAAAQSVTTDVKGNMTSIPANLRESGATTALNLVWDFDNRMRSADIDANGSADVTFTYDALGRRVTRSHSSGSWVFVQSDQQTLCDYVIGQGPSNALYRYVYASYIDEPVVRKETGNSGTILYYHRNQQYSIYALTNSSGTVQERYAYTAYGQPTILSVAGSLLNPQSSTLTNRYTYTGREWDDSVGLHFFRARWVAGNSGRFLSRDPIGYVPFENSLYRFCRSLPLSQIDPLGLSSEEPIGPGSKVWVMCRTEEVLGIFRHCQLTSSCTPGWEKDDNGLTRWIDCYPVVKDTNCTRRLFNKDGSCPKSCCEATDHDIYNCLDEILYNPGRSCPGSNCQSNTAHRLAKCCLSTSWTPSWYGGPTEFPEDPRDTPQCLVWHYEIKTQCFSVGSGGVTCVTRRVRVCDVRLPEDYHSKPISCQSGHYEYRFICSERGCASVKVFVCDSWGNWQAPDDPSLFPFI